MRRGSALDADMAEEFRLHMELRASDLARDGIANDEALRRARADFGGAYNYAQLGREARGLAWFDWARVSWLDFKLGARMIARYPGLTIMAALAMGVAITIGAGVSGAIATMKNPSLPLPEGERIVGIQLWDVGANRPERRIVREFDEWRDHLRTVSDVGAFRPAVMSITGNDGRTEGLRGVEMSASGFRVARVPPLLGRYLIDSDERPSAAPVVVLGYDAWRAVFNGDSSVIGRSISVNAVSHSIVGVMPPGFEFPVSYSIWTPLRLDAVDYARHTGPGLFVFGRLAKGATLDQARTELTTVSAAAARAYPATNDNMRARVLPFSQSWFDLDDADMGQAFWIMEIIVVFLVVVICVNVATLIYARTATRQTEITVRSALGATRGRIVAQLFGEACVLAACGAGVGLGLLSFLISRAQDALAQFGVTGIPFWIRFDVSGATLAYIVALAVLGALIIGVLPALQVTGARVQLRLQQLAGGNSTIRMGRLWTVLIIAEVAFAVALLPGAVRFSGEWLRTVATGPGFPADEYLSAVLAMGNGPTPGSSATDSLVGFLTRYDRSRDALVAALATDPDVLGVTYSSAIPGSAGPSRIEADTQSGAGPETATDSPGREHLSARVARVARGYFDAFDIPLLAGRAFGPADADSGATAVVVNHAFVESVFGGANAIGHRVRTLTYDEHHLIRGPWRDIVGVVGDFPAEMPFPDFPRPAMYEAAGSGRMYPVGLAIHVRGDPVRFAERVRVLASRVQPAFVLRQVRALDDRMDSEVMPLEWIAISLAAVTLSVLMLSCAGIYALMSVIVTQRRREVGIRVALGAERRQVLWTLFSRATAQVIVGAAIGIAVAVAFDRYVADRSLLGSDRTLVLACVAVCVILFAIVAAVAPARRALGIPPTSALKAE
jgi:predicted permease